jgi:acyl dehydratase
MVGTMETWGEGAVLSEGRITEDGVAKLRGLIGHQMRQSFRFNTEASRDGVRHFCWGIGDVNPLWFDEEYAKASSVGGLTAPPSFLYSFHPGYVQIGLPGVHGLHASSDWTLHRRVRVPQRFRAICWLDHVDQRESSFGGSSVWVTFRTAYVDESDTVIADNVSTSIRTEREAGRKRKRSRREMTLWTEEGLAPVEKAIDAYERRGAEPRYWEDVEIGDITPDLVKGPLTTTDMIAWYVGCIPVYMPAHEAARRHYQRHPQWTFRNPELGVLEPNIRVHENIAAARSSGVSAPYDVGIQRHQWMFQLMTDWAGDAGLVTQCRAEYRGFNLLGDVTTLSGSVVGKERDEKGRGLVHLTITGTNHLGEVTMPGSATVALPSRFNSAEDTLEQATEDMHIDHFLARHCTGFVAL